MKKIKYSIHRVIKFFKGGLLQIILDTQRQIAEDQLLMVASSLAFTTLLSIIPLLAVSFAIFQAFGGMEKLYEMIEPLILSNLAHGASEEAITHLHRLIDDTHAGAVGAGGLAGLIFTSMSMLSSIEKAINRVWRTPLTRGLFQRISSYWLFITLGPLALSIAVGAATYFRFPLVNLFPSGTGMFLIAVGLFFSIYRWVPQTWVKWEFALISAIISASFWHLAQFGYSIYTQRVLTTSKVYGSLGAIPILMIWIYINWIIILSGTALTAALQKQREGR